MKNKDKRYVYLLTMNFLGKDYYKVGVFTGYVNSRISKILEDINHIVPVYCVRKWELNNYVNHFGYKVRQNYQVELNAHKYLKDSNVNFSKLPFSWFPDIDKVAKMSGKTEWFDCTEKQAISAVLNAIQWANLKPAKIKDDMVITEKGFITKYRKGIKPDYEKIAKTPNFEKLDVFLKTATKKELRQLDIKGKIGDTGLKHSIRSETKH